MEQARHHQELKLRNGRTLGLAEYGTTGGKPLFFFHDFPGSRLDWLAFDTYNQARQFGLRVLALDRPGVGLSSPVGGRTLLDWARDVEEVAEQLELGYFGVLGVGGGGPYAAACAYALADRLDWVGIAMGMCPPEAPGVWKGLSMKLPGQWWLARVLGCGRLAKTHPADYAEQLATQLIALDRPVLERELFREAFETSLRQAFRQGGKGLYSDANIYRKPWGFALSQVELRVRLWFSEDDRFVPVSASQWLVDQLPESSATFLPAQGHYSWLVDNFGDLLSTVR